MRTERPERRSAAPTSGNSEQFLNRLFARPGNGRPTTCAGIVARNEGTFLEVAVESVIPAVDEVIIVENGSIDETNQTSRELATKHPKVRLLELADDTFLADARNAIDDATQCDWILWWDADFVAWSHEEAPERSIEALLDRVHLERHCNQVLYGGPNIGPAYTTQLRAKPWQGLSGDTQLTRKGLMRFKVEEFIDTRFYTGERRTLYINKQPFLLHLDKVKPLGRLVLRDLLYKFETSNAHGVRNDETFRRWVLATQPSFTFRSARNWVLKRLAEGSAPLSPQALIFPKLLALFLEAPYFEADIEDDRVVAFRQVRAFPGDAAFDDYFKRLGLG